MSCALSRSPPPAAARRRRPLAGHSHLARRARSWSRFVAPRVNIFSSCSSGSSFTFCPATAGLCRWQQLLHKRLLHKQTKQHHEQSPRAAALHWYARGTEQPSPHSQRSRAPHRVPHLASASRLVSSLSPSHQFLLPTSVADTSLARPCPCLLPQRHARPPRPGTRLASHPSHTRPCVRRPPDVNALERDQDEGQAHQVDPCQAGARNSHRAHSPGGRAPRARITTRSPTVYWPGAHPTYLSPMRRRWVAPFCSSGLPPSA